RLSDGAAIEGDRRHLGMLGSATCRLPRLVSRGGHSRSAGSFADLRHRNHPTVPVLGVHVLLEDRARLESVSHLRLEHGRTARRDLPPPGGGAFRREKPPPRVRNPAFHPFTLTCGW